VFFPGQPPHSIKIGQGEVIQNGDDLLIIAIGSSVCEAIVASQTLKEKNIHATVINARFVKPLDKELIIEYAGKIKNIITVEEHVLDGGFGSAVVELIMDQGLSGNTIKRIGINDRFVEHGPQSVLRRDYEVDSQAIINAAINICDGDIEE